MDLRVRSKNRAEYLKVGVMRKLILNDVDGSEERELEAVFLWIAYSVKIISSEELRFAVLT